MKIGNKANPLIFILAKRSKHLVIIGIIAVVLSSMFSSEKFIKPKFKASTVFYPVNILPYGQESPVEQTLQILEGNEIRDEIIKRFDLASHYKIDATSAGYYSKVINTYKDNITFKRTRFESVEIQVLDTDPLISKKISDEIVNLFNLKAQQLQRKKSREVVIAYGNHLQKNQKIIDSLEIHLQEIRTKYGILDYNLQVQEVTRGYFSGAGKDKAIEKEARELLSNLQNKGGAFFEIQGKANSLRVINDGLLEKYNASLLDISKELTYSDIVSDSRIPDKKSYPVRWLIVLSTTIATLLLAVTVFAFLDGKEELNESNEILTNLVRKRKIKVDI